MSYESDRPYSLSEQDYSSMITVIKTMRLFEYLSDETNPTLGTIECELVSSALHLLAGQLEQVMTNIDGNVTRSIDSAL